MHGNIPLELRGAAALFVVLVQRTVAHQDPCIPFPEQVKAIANQAERVPREIGTGAEAADVRSRVDAPPARRRGRPSSRKQNAKRTIFRRVRRTSSGPEPGQC